MGVALGDNTTASELINNIYEFVLLKEVELGSELEKQTIKNSKEKKVIKKYKYKNAA